MPISPLPPVPDRTDSPENFSIKADNFLGALPAFRNELNNEAQSIIDRANNSVDTLIGIASAGNILITPQLAQMATAQIDNMRRHINLKLALMNAGIL